MALVNLLRFDRDSCALVSDEEYWHSRRRRLLYGDFVQSLLTEEISENLDLEVVYGASGVPSFAIEVVNRTRTELQKIYSARKTLPEKKKMFRTVDDVAQILLRNLQFAFRRWADAKLKSLYGFDSDDLNRNFFEKDGEKIEIKQKSVKEAALKIAQTAKRGTPLDNFLEHQGLIVGWDKEKGIQAYYFNYEDFILYQSSTDIDCIGKGKDVSQVILANYLNRKHLNARRKGYDRAEGLIELILSGFEAQTHDHEVGGYFNIVYINGNGKNHKERFIEANQNTARVANEIVIAYKSGLIKKVHAFSLIKDIIFERKDYLSVEEDLFAKTENPVNLDFILRGYKQDFIPSGVEIHDGIPSKNDVSDKSKGGESK
jgi:hypothetical protein